MFVTTKEATIEAIHQNNTTASEIKKLPFRGTSFIPKYTEKSSDVDSKNALIPVCPRKFPTLNIITIDGTIPAVNERVTVAKPKDKVAITITFIKLFIIIPNVIAPRVVIEAVVALKEEIILVDAFEPNAMPP